MEDVVTKNRFARHIFLKLQVHVVDGINLNVIKIFLIKCF